jgi:hypothetical protein
MTGSLKIVSDITSDTALNGLVIDLSKNTSSANSNQIITGADIGVDVIAIKDIHAAIKGVNVNVSASLTDVGSHTNSLYGIDLNVTPYASSNETVYGVKINVDDNTTSATDYGLHVTAANNYFSGNVGIGTTSAQTVGGGKNLTVYGDAPEITLVDNASGTPYAWIATNDYGSLILSADRANEAGSTYMRMDVDGTERMRIASDGKVFIGSTSSRALSGVNPQMQIEGTDYSTSSMSLIGNTGTSAGTAPLLMFGRSRGTSDGTSTAVASGDRFGAIFFTGADGTDINTVGAYIEASVDGSVSGNTMPGRIQFYTNSGGSSASERMRIDKDGNLGIGTTSINSNAKVHIRGGDSGQTSSSNNTQLTVESNSTAGIQLLTGTTNVGGIWVGDSNGSETGGKLYYSNSSDSWIFYNQGSIKSVDLGTSMLNLYDNDTGSAGSNLKQLSLGKSDSTYWDTTNSGTFTGAIISNSNNDAGTACGIAFSTRASSSGISYVVSRNEAADKSSLHFGTRGSDGVARRMLIGDDGAVQITANSNNKASLNVIGSGTGQAPNDGKVYVEKNSSNDWSFLALAGADDYGFKTKGVGNHAIVVTNQSSDSNVFRVEYDGDILASNTSISSISDRRLKKEITNATSQWDDIKALNFVNYKWKQSTGMDDSVKYLGLIADEVESVSPSLIKINAQSKEDIEAGVEDPEYKTVKYSIVWMKAVKALQEAMEKIETLEAQMAQVSGSN